MTDKEFIEQLSTHAKSAVTSWIALKERLQSDAGVDRAATGAIMAEHHEHLEAVDRLLTARRDVEAWP